MGVYIRNMEKPENCAECIFESGVIDLRCSAKKDKKIPRSGIERYPDWCPIIDVQPHGRLIDADAVLNGLAHKLGIRNLEYLTQQERAIVSWFKCAPTIIPKDT